MWVPPQSKFHHLERKKKRGSNGPFSRAMLVYQRVPIRNGDFPIAMVVSPLLKAALTRRHHWVLRTKPHVTASASLGASPSVSAGSSSPDLGKDKGTARLVESHETMGTWPWLYPPHNFRRLWCLVNGNSRILKWRYASTIFLAHILLRYSLT